MTSATSDLLLPGYWVDEVTGAWCTLPWPSEPDERVAIARSSLGPGIIDWAEGRTDEPGLIDYQTGRPWRYTSGQKRFLILWYWVNEDGRFLYRSGVKRGAKGTGKDPFGASWANTELRGPVEMYDWDERAGRPVGRPRGMPLVQVMSNSEAQSKDVLRVANAMWSPEAREFYDLDCGETRTVVKTGGRLEVPPSSEASAEGDPATAIMLNETHHMTESSGGERVARVARRNVAKSPASVQARVLEFTNAHRQGSDSVAERSFEAWQTQTARGYHGRRDILYDSVEAPPGTDIMTEEGRMAGLHAAYSDAPWADLRRLSDEMLDRRTTVADTIRYYLNGLGTEEDAWIEPPNWDQLTDLQVVADREQVALFADCSKSEDATGIVGCRLSDLYVFEVGCWERPQGWPSRKPWRAPRAEVDATVRNAVSRWDVVWLGIDPSPAKDDEDDALYWRAMVDGLHRDLAKKLPVWATPGAGGSSVLFDMRLSQRGARQRNQTFTETAEYVASLIDDDEPAEPLRHDGSPRLRTHVHNARRRPNPWGVSLGKVTRDSNKHVDLAVCMVGAVMGARLALNSGKLQTSRTGRVWA